MKNQSILTTVSLCLFLALFTANPSTLKAQGYYNLYEGESPWDLTFNIGPSNFLGDVGGGKGKGTAFVKDLNMPVTNIFYGVYATFYPRQWYGIRASYNMGKLAGFDSLIKNQGGFEKDRKNRNLGFRSSIKEFYVALELYPSVFWERQDGEGVVGRLRPYGLIGIGAFSFKSQGQYQHPDGTKTWVDLRPLRTEGQGMTEYPDRKMYSQVALQVPMGLGLKYFVGQNTFIGLEVLQRFTFTDYIDDVSKTYVDPNLFNKYLSKEQVPVAQQMMFKRGLINNRPIENFINKDRGDSKNKDYYVSILFKIGVRLGHDNNYGARSQIRCSR